MPQGSSCCTLTALRYGDLCEKSVMSLVNLNYLKKYISVAQECWQTVLGGTHTKPSLMSGNKSQIYSIFVTILSPRSLVTLLPFVPLEVK